MPLFSRSNTLGRETAQRLISGHMGLIAYWALRHANVIDAMLAEPKQGIDPSAFAGRTSMASDVLMPLLEYLSHAGLVNLSGGRAMLTPAGRALREHEDGVLELIRAYQPALNAVEHLLARLKIYGGNVARKADTLLESQTARYGDEVFPAIEKAVLRSGCTHVLDLNCGTGDLLLRLGKATKNLAGVGVCTDGPSVRKANDAISKAGLEKRFLAVTGNPLDVCTDTREAFERLGISTGFWEQVDGVVACNVFGELAGRDSASAIAAMARLPRVFPGSTVIVAEPCIETKREQTYYAAELDMLLAVSRHRLLPLQQWRDMAVKAGMKVVGETGVATDSISVFVCEPVKRVTRATPKQAVSPGG